jgi:hypothetical protein
MRCGAINAMRIMAGSVTLLIGTAVCRGDLVSYSSRAEFQAAVPQLVTEGFNTSFGSAAQSVDFGPFSVSASGAVNPLVQWSSDDIWKTEGAGAILAADFSAPNGVEAGARFAFDEPIRAFGIDVTNIGTATLRYSVDLGVQEDLVPDSTGSLFLGFVSDESISRVDFRWNPPFKGIGFDNLQYSVVPEPGGLIAAFLAMMFAVMALCKGATRHANRRRGEMLESVG